MGNTMKKIIRTATKIFAAAAALAFAALAAGCSRYAPVPVPEAKVKILEIVLTTAAPVSNDYYYYIAFDTSDPLTAEGPLEILSGAQRGENWTYYIRLKNREFTEQIIQQQGDIDEEPTVFNHSSLRFFQTIVSGNTITVRLFIASNNLSVPPFAPPKPIAFNLITSTLPLTPTDEDIEPLDYLIRPRVSVPTGAGGYTDNTLNALSSSHTVDNPADAAADIISWSVEVYER